MPIKQLDANKSESYNTRFLVEKLNEMIIKVNDLQQQIDNASWGTKHDA